MRPRQAHQRSEVCDKRIAIIFEVKFEPLGRKYCCASCRSAILSRKRQCGALKQENSTDPPVDVTGNPETFLIAADEKCGDRLVDDPRIETPKLCGNRAGLLDRQNSGAFPLARRRPRFLPSRKVRAHQLHGDHRALIDCVCVSRDGRGRTCSASAAARRIRLLTKASSISRKAARTLSSCSRTCSFRPAALKVVVAMATFLTNPTGMMCPRRHRKARWLGVVSHKRKIEMDDAAPHALRAFMPRL